VNATDEFTHYEVPGGRGDIILYRRPYDSKHPLAHLSLAASMRSADDDWSAPVVVNIADDNANLNAGALPDGRVYLLSNAMPNAFRDPLFLSTSADGIAFDRTVALTSCEQRVYASPRQPIGCLARHAGGSKQGGCQYPQAHET
jgi:hypothetical protein